MSVTIGWPVSSYQDETGRFFSQATSLAAVPGVAPSVMVY